MEQHCYDEAPLLQPRRDDVKGRWPRVWGEVRKLGATAAPMMVVTVVQFLPQVISTMMAGHLGQLSLSTAAIALSFADITGFSVLLGMAGALETLCGQMYGAEEYRKLGEYTYCAMISLSLICVPVSVLWTYVDRILAFSGQDPEISRTAGTYAVCLIPALFGYAILQTFVRYFQTQSLITPMLTSSCLVLCIHVPLCWALTFKLGLGNAGAALAIGITYWLTVACMAWYMKVSSACEKTRVRFTVEALLHVKEFIRYAIPSALMLWLDYASFELLIFLCGFLPNAKLEASIFSVCLTTTTSIFYIPYGIGAAASTRVSNELGTGNGGAAKLVTTLSAVIAAGVAFIGGVILYCGRNVLGYAYSNDKEVVKAVKEMVPLLCLSIGVDSLVGVFSGIARGGGWQNVGAYANFGSYYLVGIPLAIYLGFVQKFRGRGLWIGILTGSTLQALLLSLITLLTNWDKEVEKARERIFEDKNTQNDIPKLPISSSDSAH